MYLACTMRPDDPANRWGTALLLEGKPAQDRLERALAVLRDRHDALRTTFHEHDGRLVQAVHAPGGGGTSSAVLDIREAEGESEAERRAWAEAEALRLMAAPFDLAAGPLWRPALIRIAAETHLLVLAFHHLVVDEVSAQVLADELRLAYADPEAAALAPPPAQYSDFCLAENDAGVDPDGLEHWRRRLAGAQPVRLPEDGTQQRDGATGAKLPLPLPPRTLAGFETFCRSRSATLFMGLLAVYFVLLRRWAGGRDVTVGTQVLSRPHSSYFETIGLFTNTVALHCQASPELTFDEFLDLVSDTVHDAFDHQHVPFDAVVDALAPRREGDRNPLFDVAISYGTLDADEVWALDGLRVTPLPEPSEVSRVQYDLALDIQRTAGGVALTVEYDRSRFSDGAARSFGRAYADLLDALAREPGRPIGAVPTLGASAREEVLALGTGTGTWDSRVPEECTSVWTLFERTAAATPEREAVVAGEERLTFAQLADRARSMAAGLRDRGVRTGTVVGVCLPRNGDLAAALLATWCAGGAFLLLDPGQPEARRRVLLREAGAALVVAQAPSGDVETVTPAALSSGGDAGRAVAHGPVHRPGAAPAYVVFTSGSTGRPKGVVVDQESLVSHTAGQLALLYEGVPEGVQLNVGATSAVTFDVFVNQCLGMIAFGHRLLLLDEDERRDPLRLLARGSDPASAIDVLDCSSSQTEILVDAGLLALPHPPKILVIGGESPSDRLWQRLREEPGVRAFNIYGLTECTVDSTLARLWEQPRRVAGRAAGAARIHVLDDQLQLLPPLFVGEVYVGGLGVAQGYAGQPAQTSGRFVADPFAPAPGRRMFRTGDRGRLLPDGQLEIWGRADDQVKVRGLRVEPGELETELAGHPGVARAAVVATDAGTPKARLVAFVVPEDGAADGLTAFPSSVREFLRGRIPSALLPDRIELVEEFPVTAHGKLDRAALVAALPSLPEPDTDPDTAPGGAADPDSRERRLCEIAAEVVGVPRMAPGDNFFARGGNSLLAMMFMSRVHSDLGHELTLRDVFEARSIKDIADLLGAGGGGGGGGEREGAREEVLS